MAIIAIENESQWHKIREKHLGGSDVSALFDANPYTTLHELWAEKRGILTGIFSNPLAEFGKVMEPIIAHLAAAENGWTIQHCKEYHEHPQHKHLGCTLDYYILEMEDGDSLCQIKNVQHFAPGWTKTRAPDYVEYQVVHEFEVANAARIEAGLKPFSKHMILSMHSGNPEDIRIMLRGPNKKAWDAIVDRSTKFWNEGVIGGKEPPLVGAEEYAHIAEMFKLAQKDKDPFDLRGRPDIDDLVAQHEAAKMEESAAKKRKEDLKGRIMRHCMEIVDNQVIGYNIARTDNYLLELKEMAKNISAVQAHVRKELRFSVKEVKAKY